LNETPAARHIDTIEQLTAQGGTMQFRNTRNIFAACFVIVAAGTSLAGCAGVKETARGIAGVSTRVLEDGRAAAIKKTYAFDHAKCKDTVNTVLSENNVYVYDRDESKKMIAFYLTVSDTTPVGVFFAPQSNNTTEVAVSSASRYAKEFIADKIAEKFDKLLNPLPESAAAKPPAVVVNQTAPKEKK
jgi:hypothetical protein